MKKLYSCVCFLSYIPYGNPKVIHTATQLMVLITHYDHITSTNSHPLIPHYLRPHGAWLVGWMSSNKVTLRTYRVTWASCRRLADRQIFKEAHNFAKGLYIGVLITDAVLYVQYAQLSVKLRWRSASTRCWYDATLQQMHQCNGSGTTRSCSICTSWYDRHPQYRSQRMFWYDKVVQYYH